MRKLPRAIQIVFCSHKNTLELTTLRDMSEFSWCITCFAEWMAWPRSRG